MSQAAPIPPTPAVAPAVTGSAAAEPFWHARWEFAVHTLVGTSIFTIIAVAAVLLNLGVHRLEAYDSDTVVIIGLMAAEYGLFSVDLLLYVVFLWRTAKRTIQRL
jgi:hypothetical protein